MSLSYYLTVLNVYKHSIEVFAMLNGEWFTVFSLLFSLIVSIFFGIYVALLVFKRDIQISLAPTSETMAGVGGFISLIATGCPACGAPLLGLIGMPLGLFTLPFKGSEIKVLAILLLILSVYLVSKNIKNLLSCEVKK